MRLKESHLTYCLSIHPGSTLDENFAAISKYTAEVKKRVSPNKPFGLGLRLSAAAAAELERRSVPDLRKFLDDSGMYAFTVNVFPYGEFHSGRIKEGVYLPDWSDGRRLEYTCSAARILAGLLPDGVTGSLSTLPVAYGKILPEGAVRNLAECADFLEKIEKETGKTIILALEPEPDCYLETAADVIAFRKRVEKECGGESLRFIGACLDTCHHAVNFLDPLDELEKLENAGAPVPKIHVSSAIRYFNSGDAAKFLAPFADEVYLHQTRVKNGPLLFRYPDLPEAIRENPPGEWCIHYHVPLGSSPADGLETTAPLLSREFFDLALSPGRHVEIETYTFHIFPGVNISVVDSIVSEFEWLISRSGRAFKL
jgi:hypothetical protein